MRVWKALLEADGFEASLKAPQLETRAFQGALCLKRTVSSFW